MNPSIPADIGKYRIIRGRGHGQFGTVYEARDRHLGSDWALKVIPAPDADQVVSSLKEARILDHCEHKHIVKIREADVARVGASDSVIIACELCDRSVQDLIESEPLSVRSASSMVCQALFGLEYLHNSGVLHCDLKPSNLLLKKSVVKLSDFGLAIYLQHQNSPSHTYRVHRPPDVLDGNGWTVACDIYAMGVTLYRLVNRITDLRSHAPPDLDEQIRRGRFPDRHGYAAHVPDRLKKICNKAMHPNPASRFPNAVALRQALEKIAWEVDWSRTSAHEWQGLGHGKHHKLIAFERSGRWDVDFLANNRRRRDRCAQGLTTELEALAYMDRAVMQTSVTAK